MIFEKVKRQLQKISDLEPKVNALIDVFPGEALAKARELDELIARKKQVGRLAGMTFAVKNNLAVKGKRMTCASRMLENYVAPYNATVVERVLQEDGIIIATANMDEFACGSDTTKSALKVTRNPLDLQRVPGGSSGGSAAAVAAGFCDVALGSDTGGSVRTPASFCNVIGFKPSYGGISRYGLADMAMSFDQIGILARNHGLLLKVFQVISGRDEKDQTSLDLPVETIESLKGLKIGFSKQFFKGCEPLIGKAVMQKLRLFESKGAKLVGLEVQGLELSLPTYYLLVYSEFSSAMQKYDGFKYGAHVKADDLVSSVSMSRGRNFGKEVKRRILLGTFITMEEQKDQWYSKALQAREFLINSFGNALKKCDLLAMPTMPVLPWKVGEMSGSAMQMYLTDVLTVTANICGLPAISLPCSFEKGLPIGIQFIGRRYSDSRLLSFARLVGKN